MYKLVNIVLMNDKPKKLIVEVDGKYHDTPEMQEADNFRTNYLNSLGYNVVRFTNEEVIGDTESVLNKIENALQIPPSGGGVAKTPSFFLANMEYVIRLSGHSVWVCFAKRHCLPDSPNFRS